MIDKKKVGRYLKELRNLKKLNEGKFTQDDLIDALWSDEEERINKNSISQWEKGDSLPSISNLTKLAKIYNKEIEEILDGEDNVEINFKDKYFLANPNWPNLFENNTNIYIKRNEQILLITSTFKKLLTNRIERMLTQKEENELKFLFENFYILSDYAKNKNKDIVEDDYFIFICIVNEIIYSNKFKTKKEKYWEIQKLYLESELIWFTFRLDVHDMLYEDILQSRFNNLEDWQKDMLLAMFQNILPFDAENASKFGSGYLKRYESSFGEYDFNGVNKKIIKKLIEGGACINKLLLNQKHIYDEVYRIIDRLEMLYDKCLKPLEVRVLDDNKEWITVKIENNFRNRFIVDYFNSLSFNLNGAIDDNKFEEIYDWFINNDVISDDIYLKIAKKRGIDTNREKKYWLSDVKRVCYLDQRFNECKTKEIEINKGLEEIKLLNERLSLGEKEYSAKNTYIIGGNNEDSIREHISIWMTEWSYHDYMKHREKELTKKLLLEIDTLDIDQIREKYFKMEVIEDE